MQMIDACNKKMKWVHRLLTAFFCMITVFTLIISHKENMLVDFTRQDGVVSWIQVVFLTSAGILFFIVSYKRKISKTSGAWLSFLAGLFCLLVMLEEISYGQRIIGYESPYYFHRHNVHREVNIHNLIIFDNALDIAALLIYLVWCVLLPLLIVFKNDWKNILTNAGFFILPKYIAVFCIAGLFLEFGLRSLYRGYHAGNNEILELYLYLSLFGASLISFAETAFKKDKLDGGKNT